MRKTLLVLLFSLVAMHCGAQMLTSYAAPKFNFESTGDTAKVYYQGQLLGTTPFTVEVKAAYRTETDQQGLSEFEIYTRNTIIIEREIRESGEDEGIVSRFSMDFTFVGKDGVEKVKTVRLMWKPVSVLGKKGYSIYYPPLVRI